MTDTTNGADAPPKKRFGFKKAAWQTAPKTEAQDMFSHANEFSNVVAEETKRKLEAKKKAEKAQKRKVSEEHESKRRKVSLEKEEKPVGSPRAQRLASRGRSKTPLSSTRHGSTSDTLTARYDSLTKSSSSSEGAARKSEVVDLGSDSEDEVPPHVASPSLRSIPIHSRSGTHRGSSEELEEVDNPYAGASKPQAREVTTIEDDDDEFMPVASQIPKPPDPVAIVELFVTSDIPDTKPMKIKVKTDMTIQRAKEAWCGKQGFSPAGTKTVFFTWQSKRIFSEFLKIQRLGLEINNGFVTVKDDPTIYDDDNLPKIHVEAWTDEVWKRRLEEDKLEAAKAKHQVVEVEEEPVPEPAPEPESKKLRLFLKAKGKDDFKIVVRGSTTVEQLQNAYKQNFKIPEEDPITLYHDGDRMKTMDAIEAFEVEDMDAIEVHFK